MVMIFFFCENAEKIYSEYIYKKKKKKELTNGEYSSRIFFKKKKREMY